MCCLVKIIRIMSNIINQFYIVMLPSIKLKTCARLDTHFREFEKKLKLITCLKGYMILPNRMVAMMIWRLLLCPMINIHWIDLSWYYNINHIQYSIFRNYMPSATRNLLCILYFPWMLNINLEYYRDMFLSWLILFIYALLAFLEKS